MAAAANTLSPLRSCTCARLPVLSRHPVARLAPLVRYGQHPQLIGLHLVDEIVGKAPQGKPTDGAAEWPPGERVVADPRHRS